MAARLPVVISQSSRREPLMVTCEEKLITQLLFASGLDATLIGPLESVEMGSTDHLCLEGLKGPFALLGWTSIAECQLQLVRLGVHGSIVDRDAASPASVIAETSNSQELQRRIDCFQLRSDREPSFWIDSLRKILEVREVKAFQIQTPRTKSAPPTVSGRIMESQEIRTVAVKNEVHSEHKTLAISKAIDLNADDEAWEHLDSLVEDLDRSDV